MPILGTDPIQNWGPSVNYKDYSYTSGIVSPSIATVDFVIKDIAAYLVNTYSDFRLKSEVLYPLGDPIPWLDPSSYEDHGYYSPYNFYVPYNYGMTFSFTPIFQNLDTMPSGISSFRHQFTIQGLNNAGLWDTIETYNYDINMNVISVVVDPSPVLSFTPENLSFTHQQNNPLPTKSVAMTGNLWKVVGKPNFILSSTTAGVIINTVGTGTLAYQTVSGSGNAFIEIALGAFYDSEAAFAPTDLSGVFDVLEDNVAFGSIDWTVNVVRLSDFVNLPFAPGEKLFTLDQDYFEFSSNNVGTYFQVDALVKTYDFFTNALNEFSIPQKVVLFQGKAKVNLGQVIHRLMKKFNTVNENLLQYKITTVDLIVSEILFADESIIRAGTITNIPFVAGLSRGITNIGFLNFNPLTNRATKKGFAYLNMFYPSGNYELRTFKNGDLHSSVALPVSSDTIVCKKVSFSAFDQGDFIQYIIDTVGENNSNAPKKAFYILPEGNFSNTIVWQNEFLLQSALECTGTASIKSDFEFISQKVWENLTEILEHLSSSKEVKLYVNTGWLIQTDVDSIESLMRSKRAWLLNTKGNIAIRPISKSMVNQDLDRELIEFNLEFTINRAYDEETYSL